MTEPKCACHYDANSQTYYGPCPAHSVRPNEPSAPAGQPSEAAVEMAEIVFNMSSMWDVATALQKLMDEREAAAIDNMGLAKRAEAAEAERDNAMDASAKYCELLTLEQAENEHLREEAEAAEKERDHWADKFLEEQRQHTEAVTRAEAAEGALAARIEKASEELDAAFREGMCRVEAAEKERDVECDSLFVLWPLVLWMAMRS